jgi:hypothetical protein
MPRSLFDKKNSVLFPEGYDSHTGQPEEKTAIKHKWVQQGNGFVCIACPYRHTNNLSASKYTIDNYELKRL